MKIKNNNPITPTDPSKINIKITPSPELKMEACGCGKAWGRNEDTNCDICGNTGLVEVKQK
jgi:hypothetical protein